MDSASESTAQPSYLAAHRGLLSWLFSLDHKRIGVMYLVSVLTFFFVGGMLALVLRLELLTPPGDIVGPDTYNKLFTLHGAIMVFAFIIPLIPATLGNIFVPLLIGARDVAFPRINLLAYHLYVTGSLFLLYAILAGSMDTGWTFYTPYSTETGTAVISATLGVLILGLSAFLTGLNFIVTIHKLRAPGMTWSRMPLFLWSLYAGSMVQVFVTPVLAVTLLLLVLERNLGIGIFDPAMGGDPVLFQHFFWFYSHPATAITIVPAFGIISEVIAVHARKRIFGYNALALSFLAIAALSVLSWGQHMFVSGQSALASLMFSFLALAIAVPSAISICAWIATLYGGAVRFTSPMLYGLAFLFTFTIGALGGLFLSSLPTDIHLHDTYFAVAQFHYVMVGGTLMAFLAGLHHWWPKVTGKAFSEAWARAGAMFVFLGLNLTFFPQFILGAQGMPRRYHSYHLVSPDRLPLFEDLHTLSSIGSVLLVLGFVTTLGYLVHSVLRGQPAPQNPWGGVSLEWRAESPPIQHNFATHPGCSGGPYDFPEIEGNEPSPTAA